MVLVLIAFGAGCDAEEVAAEDDLDLGEEVSLRHAVDNSSQLNGMRINGMRINGMRINGAVLLGDTLNDAVEVLAVDLPGADEMLDSSYIDGSLQVATVGGAVLKDAALTGTLVKLNVTENGVSKARDMLIQGMSPLGSQPGVWLYDIVRRDPNEWWNPVCVDGVGVPTQSIVLNEVWNPTTGAKITPRPSGAVTFACRGAALAKCVEFGYVPWKVQNGVSLADHHQACTRMVRADYCGDGKSHTVNGMKIHVLDQVGVQNADTNVKYVVEAEWGPNGAVCLNPGNTRLANQTIGCQIPTCGASFASGGLIQSGKLVAP